jgi:hypothetical protein
MTAGSIDLNQASDALARDIVIQAQKTVANLCPIKLKAFHRRFIIGSERWRLIATIVATYATFRALTAKASDDVYHKTLSRIPQALQEQVGRQFSLVFQDFISVLREDYKKSGKITAGFLGRWAFLFLSASETPKDGLGLIEIFEETKIGEELLLIVVCRADSTST